MRQKYNVFAISKINKRTIEIARKLKGDIEKVNPFKKSFLLNSELSHVPIDKSEFLEYLCTKYLQLKAEDGLPLLKEAFKQQYNVEDEYKLCKYCGKTFQFARPTSVFCSNRCRQRFYRNQKSEKRKSSVLR